MTKAIIKKPFSMIQWHGEEYPYYESDAEESAYRVGDVVAVLHEAKPNPMRRLFVIFNERTNKATVVSESYLDFVKE